MLTKKCYMFCHVIRGQTFGSKNLRIFVTVLTKKKNVAHRNQILPFSIKGCTANMEGIISLAVFVNKNCHTYGCSFQNIRATQCNPIIGYNHVKYHRKILHLLKRLTGKFWASQFVNILASFFQSIKISLDWGKILCKYKWFTSSLS